VGDGGKAPLVHKVGIGWRIIIFSAILLWRRWRTPGTQRTGGWV